jgi:hypothetical protein
MPLDKMEQERKLPKTRLMPGSFMPLKLMNGILYTDIHA